MRGSRGMIELICEIIYVTINIIRMNINLELPGLINISCSLFWERNIVILGITKSEDEIKRV